MLHGFGAENVSSVENESEAYGVKLTKSEVLKEET
jgi:hypothetical protein